MYCGLRATHVHLERFRSKSQTTKGKKKMELTAQFTRDGWFSLFTKELTAKVPLVASGTVETATVITFSRHGNCRSKQSPLSRLP